jgi:hypothetical protein
LNYEGQKKVNGEKEEEEVKKQEFWLSQMCAHVHPSICCHVILYSKCQSFLRLRLVYKFTHFPSPPPPPHAPIHSRRFRFMLQKQEKMKRKRKENMSDGKIRRQKYNFPPFRCCFYW